MYWAFLTMGLWIAVSPWLASVLGLALGVSNVIIGSLIALFALWSLFGKTQ